jgi:tartrate-resistant acid phosphatase type 5
VTGPGIALRTLVVVVALTLLVSTALPPPANQLLGAQQTTLVEGDTLRFAVIGDYGYEGEAAAQVSALVRGWQPELVITTGDNNYPSGSAATIDANVGQYYAPFIAPYRGTYGPGGANNQFFPTLGNHDWETPDALPYLDYFTLPGNERYYDFTAGPVQFFALDSDPREPDGITDDSAQAVWLESRLSRSRSPWRVVYLHHPPYSSGVHGSTPATQWRFASMGATAVLAGHDHSYERLVLDGLPYFVNGLGGTQTYGFWEPLPGSRARFTGAHGAMLVEATPDLITYRLYIVGGNMVDEYRQCRAWAWQPGKVGCTAGAWGGRSR